MQPSPEARRRNAYISDTLKVTQQMVAYPEIALQIGQTAVGILTDRLSSVVIANVANGEVHIPKGSRDNPSALPLVAIFDGEAVRLGKEFGNQTGRQKANTIRTIESWCPNVRTAEEEYDEFASTPAHHPTPFTFSPLVSSTAYNYTALLNPNDLKTDFSNAPKRGITYVHLRPAILYKIVDGQTHAQPDSTVHGIAHVDRLEREPVNTVVSQRSIDMLALSAELEACYLGSIFARHRLRRSTTPLSLQLLLTDPGVIQIAVETVRQEHNAYTPDPFTPSKLILEDLKTKDLDYVVRATQNYTILLAQLQRAIGAK
jgi:hypothetical protein